MASTDPNLGLTYSWTLSEVQVAPRRWTAI